MESWSDGTLKTQSYALVKAAVTCLTGDSTSLDFAVMQASTWINQAENYLYRCRERFQATQRRFAWIRYKHTLQDVKDATNEQQQPGLIRRSSHHVAESFKLAMQDYALLGQTIAKPFVAERQPASDVIIETPQRQTALPQRGIMVLDSDWPTVTPRDPMGGRTSFHTPWAINNDRPDINRTDINQSPLALLKARAQAQSQGQLPFAAGSSAPQRLLGQQGSTSTTSAPYSPFAAAATPATRSLPISGAIANERISRPAAAPAAVGGVRTFLEPIKTAAGDVSGSFASDRYSSVHHFRRVLQQRPSQRRAVS
ncbi:MAG: hypothetical protein HQL58_12000 [Magnetococcales bacterium]|nr:hypothetical protein [Magnetococcales bacterium]